ncbi:5'-3' exoribonuclease 3-like [Olea europaea var. sylvestris]|nr:5'-3' exoribonuclease 3-like [Olea europaea var. sylvestris]
MENGRHNHNTNGAISGRHLGEAAHRLVANSLQVRADGNCRSNHIYAPHPSHASAYSQRYPPYHQNPYSSDERVMMQGTSGYYPVNAGDHHRSSVSTSYRQPYASPPLNNAQNRYNYPRNEGNGRSGPQGRDYHSRNGYNRQGRQQNGGRGYPSHPARDMGRAPIPPGPYVYQQGGYSDLGAHQTYMGGSYNHMGGSWVPPVNPSVGRGSSHPRPSGNQFSALGRGGSRRPPPSDHRR